MENTPTNTEQLDAAIVLGITANNLDGFEKAYQLAEAMQKLNAYLTPDYMKPILNLQNTSLGFKTDKPDGYPEATIKTCLIDAVLKGVQPVGNQFNIIAGNCYITKEGFGYILSNIPGLKWEIIPHLPRIASNATSGAIIMEIRWTISNQPEQVRELDIAVKINKYMGSDAVIGKATRKARAWLHQTLSGNEISDGDAEITHDINHTEILDDKKQSIRDKNKQGSNEIKMP